MSSFLPKCPFADVGQPPVPAVSCFNSRPFAASCSRFREVDDHASGRAPVRYTETGTPDSAYFGDDGCRLHLYRMFRNQ